MLASPWLKTLHGRVKQLGVAQNGWADKTDDRRENIPLAVKSMLPSAYPLVHWKCFSYLL